MELDFTYESGIMVVGAYLTAEEKTKYLNGHYRIRLVKYASKLAEHGLPHLTAVS